MTGEWCRVYWGTHGCNFPRSHGGLCECDCCECDPHGVDSCERDGCAAKPPYYGPGTRFYGEDVASRGLPAMTEGGAV